MTPCPPHEMLQRLLADQLSGAEGAAAGAHVEACPHCQQTLETLTAFPAADAAGAAGAAPAAAPLPGPGRLVSRSANRGGGAALGEAELRRLRHLLGPTTPAGGPGPAPAAAAPADWPAVPGYEVVGELGRGGMGVVYRARHLRLNRPVALKLVRADAAVAPVRRPRFLVEGEALARLQHPNVVQIYDVGFHRGQPYFALELVEGGSLAERLHGQPLPAADLLARLAQAVQAAHGCGMVHRDLKPANVLLTAAGAPKLTDFGLAKTLDVDLRLTRTGEVFGTPAYMAPEQALGQAAQVGPLTDIYALGVILYEALTGRPPFLAATYQEVLQQVSWHEPVPPRHLQPQVPRDLEIICLKCLQKESRRRYASAGELADDVRRFLGGEPIRARPVGRAVRLGRRCRRNPLVAASLAAAVLVGLLAGLGLGEVTGVTKVRGRVIGLFFGEGTHGIGVNAPSQRGGAAPRPNPILGKPWPVPSSEDLANQSAPADALNREAIPPELLRKAGAGDPHRAPPQLVAILGQDQHQGQPNPPCVLYALAISLDGKTLAAGGIDKVVHLWDLETGQLRHELTGHQQPGVDTIYALAFSPDRKLLASGDRQGTIKLWDATAGREQHTLTAPSGDSYQIAFSPDGQFLGAARQGGKVQLWEVSSGKLHSSLPVNKEAWCLAFSPGGQVLASGELQDVHLWDMATGATVGSLMATSATVGSIPAELTAVQWVGFRPDGRSLVTAAAIEDRKDLALSVWDLATLREKRRLEGHTSTVLTGAWRADGRLLATAGCTDGTIRLWDMDADPPRCEVLRVIPPNVRWLHAIAFSPEGRHLAVGNPGWHGLYPAPGEARRSVPRALTGFLTSVVRQIAEFVALLGEDKKSLGGWPSDEHSRVTLAGRFPPHANGEETRSRSPRTGDFPRPCVPGFASCSPPAPPVAVLRGHTDTAWQVAFSADGKVLASGSDDKTVRLWDAQAHEPLAVIPLGSVVYGVAFRPDGTRLATGCRDNSVRLFDVASRQEVAELHGHTQYVHAVAWSPDGTRLVSGSGDSTLRVWDTLSAQERLADGRRQEVSAPSPQVVP